MPVVLLSGCYTYQPLAMPEPQAGMRVSVQLSDDGARDLASQIGPGIMHIEGDVLAADSSAVRLAVRQVESQRGISSDWRGEPVAVPRRAVIGIQQRHLSVGGTALLGGGIAAGLFALYGALGGGGLFEGNDGGGGGAPQ